MPSPIGRDQLRFKDDSLILFSPIPKGWRGREKRGTMKSSFPGTAVLWEGVQYEVVRVTEQKGGWRYELAAWNEAEAMRVSDSYDAQTEAIRETEYREAIEREGKRKKYLLMTPILGLLSPQTQRRFEDQFGILATRSTLISSAVFLVIGMGSLVLFLASSVDSKAGLKTFATSIPTFILLAGAYLFFESLLRLAAVLMMGRPFGSLYGSLGELIYRLIQGKRSRPAPEKGNSVKGTPPDPVQAQLDEYGVREPFISLLSPAEQMKFQRAFSFDFVRWGYLSAGAILVTAGFGLLSGVAGLMNRTFSFGDAFSLLIAGGLIWEQVIRLKKISRKEPAGSVLGVLVRPWIRKLEARIDRENAAPRSIPVPGAPNPPNEG